MSNSENWLRDGLRRLIAHYKTDFIVYPAVGLILFRSSWHQNAIASTFIGGGGVVAWGLAEYLNHRYVFHASASYQSLHHPHHANPDALVGGSLVAVAPGAMVVWLVCSLLAGRSAANSLVAGLVLGQSVQVYLHHIIHHGPLTCFSCIETLRRHHLMHHKRPGKNFGISTTIWDSLFGTSDS